MSARQDPVPAYRGPRPRRHRSVHPACLPHSGPLVRITGPQSLAGKQATRIPPSHSCLIRVADPNGVSPPLARGSSRNSAGGLKLLPTRPEGPHRPARPGSIPTPLEARASCRRLIPDDSRPRSPSTGARLLAYPIGDLRSVPTIPYAAPSQGPGHGSWPSWSQAAQPSARRSQPAPALGGRSARATLPDAPEAPSPRPRPASPARPPHEPPHREGARRLDPHPNWPLAVREKRWVNRTLRRKPLCLVVPRHGCGACP